MTTADETKPEQQNNLIITIVYCLFDYLIF